jgi:hypothetical protein
MEIATYTHTILMHKSVNVPSPSHSETKLVIFREWKCLSLSSVSVTNFTHYMNMWKNGIKYINNTVIM